MMPSSYPNVLITDDDPELRHVLRRTLDALGFQVTESSNGEQALHDIAMRHFDAVLMDVNMPGIGGIEACRRIRKRDPFLQILMLTVRDREADKVAALDAGADDYITKPFSIPELAARLRSVPRSASRQPPRPLSSERSNWTSPIARCGRPVRDYRLPRKSSNSCITSCRTPACPSRTPNSCVPFGEKNTASNWNTCARSCTSYAKNWRTTHLRRNTYSPISTMVIDSGVRATPDKHGVSSQS